MFRYLLLLLLTITYTNATAQLCTGSLGDPVVNIDFGSGTNTYGKALPAYSTNYTFVNNNGPNDGSYSISKTSSSGAADSWHVTNDHTGNSNGYFMIVNAAADTGTFYTDTIHGLCGNTTYEFASWIVNLNKPNSICGNSLILPNVTFIIAKLDGTVIKTIESGDIAATENPTWKQYGAYFVTQPNVRDVVIRMRNNAPGGCGNDLGLDDITFRPCGRMMNAYVAGSSSATQNICQGTAARIRINTIISGGGDDPAYQWQSSIDDGFTWQDIAGATQTNYIVDIPANALPGYKKYRLSIAEAGNIASYSCRTASNAISVYINPTPALQVTGNASLCTGDTLRATVTSTSNISAAWKGPDNFTATGNSIAINQVTDGNSGRYYVTAVSDKGCSNTDSSLVTQVHPIPVAHAGTPVTICKGERTLLEGAGGGTYQWTPATYLSNANAATPTATPLSSTQYQLTVTTAYGCTDTASVYITVMDVPATHAGDDQIIAHGKTAQLNGSYSGVADTWYWTPAALLSNAGSLTPYTTPEEPVLFTLHVTNPCGTTTDDVWIEVVRDIIVPNAFSPNGDGIHDTWLIPELRLYPNTEVSVFGRFGARVFYSKGYSKPWDGTYNNKKVPAGTYYYLIDLKNGSPRRSGSVLVL